MSILKRCPSYKESNKRSEERQEPTFYRGVRLIEVSVKRESTVCFLMLSLKKLALASLIQSTLS